MNIVSKQTDELTGDLLNRAVSEKVIVSKGCHDCVFLFFSDEIEEDSCLAVSNIDDDVLNCSKYAVNYERHPRCPLNTHSIKVVKE